MSQLAASSCSLWSKRSICSWSSVSPGLRTLLVTLGSNRLLRWSTSQNAMSLARARTSPCPEMIINFIILFKQNVCMAWECEQHVNSCFEPSTNYVSWTICASHETCRDFQVFCIRQTQTVVFKFVPWHWAMAFISRHCCACSCRTELDQQRLQPMECLAIPEENGH